MMRVSSTCSTRGISLLVCLLLCLVQLPLQANGLTLLVEVKTTTVAPLDVIDRFSGAFNVQTRRLVLESVAYTDSGMTVKMDCKEDNDPTNAEIRTKLDAVTPLVLEQHKLASAKEETEAGGFTEQQMLFITGLGSAAGAAILTVIIIGAYKSRSAALRDRKSREERHEKQRQLFPPTSDNERMWERIQALEQQTALLVTLNDAEAGEHELHEKILKDPRTIETVREGALPNSLLGGGGASSSHYSAPVLTTTSGGSSEPLVLDDVIISSTQATKNKRIAQDKAIAKGMLNDDVPWWNRSAEEAIEEDHLPPPSKQYVAKNTKGILCIQDDNLLSEKRVEALEGHWISYNPLPPLSQNMNRLLRVEGSNIHSVGIFSKMFIESGTLLFPYLRGSAGGNPKNYMHSARLSLRYGVDWMQRLAFVCKHPTRDLFCVAEDPAVRGWGCLINSRQGTVLDANCEIIWSGGDDGDADCSYPIPWVRTKATIPPLAELLMDYTVVPSL